MKLSSYISHGFISALLLSIPLPSNSMQGRQEVHSTRQTRLSGKVIAVGALCCAGAAAHIHSCIKELPDAETYQQLLQGISIPQRSSQAEYLAVCAMRYKGEIFPKPAAQQLSAFCFKNPQPIIQALAIEKEKDQVVKVTCHTVPAHNHTNPLYTVSTAITEPDTISFTNLLAKGPTLRQDGWTSRHKLFYFTKPASRTDAIKDFLGGSSPTVVPLCETACETEAGTYHISLKKTPEGATMIWVQLTPGYLMRMVAALRSKKSVN